MDNQGTTICLTLIFNVVHGYSLYLTQSEPDESIPTREYFSYISGGELDSFIYNEDGSVVPEASFLSPEKVKNTVITLIVSKSKPAFPKMVDWKNISEFEWPDE